MNRSNTIDTTAKPSAGNHIQIATSHDKTADQDIKVEGGMLKIAVPFAGTIKSPNACQ